MLRIGFTALHTLGKGSLSRHPPPILSIASTFVLAQVSELRAVMLEFLTYIFQIKFCTIPSYNALRKRGGEERTL